MNLQGVSSRFLSVSFWLTSNKAITLRRLIMPITKEEEQTVPSLCWHQEEEFATWGLAQRRRVIDSFHLYKGNTETHQKSSTVCVILESTRTGPKADAGLHSSPVSDHLTPWIWRRTAAAYKTSNCSLTQRWTCLNVITNHFQFESAEAKGAGWHFGSWK